MGSAPNRGKTVTVRADSEWEARMEAERIHNAAASDAKETAPGQWTVRVVRSHRAKRR